MLLVSTERLTMSEMFVIKKDKTVRLVLTRASSFSVNTSGKVINKPKSKNKDGNDYQFVVAKGGSILEYRED